MMRDTIPEAKSLRWLAVMFPFVKTPADDGDRLLNAIHTYATSGADKIEAQARTIELLKAEIARLRKEAQDECTE